MLPKLDLPQHTHKLTGLNKKVKYRPFTVKEQKILLQAKQTDKIEDQVNAIKQIIELCTDIKNADDLAFFDLEDLFVRIRSKSVSEEVKFNYRVKDTEEPVTIKFSLDQMQVQTPEDHNKKVMLTDNVGIMLRYPTLTMLMESTNQQSDMLLYCIDYVFDQDEVYPFSEASAEERQEWIDNLDASAMLKIAKFFDTMPALKYETTIKLQDGTEETVTFKGIQDVFT